MSVAINCIIGLFCWGAPVADAPVPPVRPKHHHAARHAKGVDPERASAGDSLAQGFGWASGFTVFATRSVSSCYIADHMPSGHFKLLLLSGGTNDVPGPCIELMRSRANADVVEWVVPVNGARSHVLAVAAAHGDKLLYYTPSRRKGVWPHPDSYRSVS